MRGGRQCDDEIQNGLDTMMKVITESYITQALLSQLSPHRAPLLAMETRDT